MKNNTSWKRDLDKLSSESRTAKPVKKKVPHMFLISVDFSFHR